MVTRQEKGKHGESLAAEFLETRGIKILARNVRCPMGEIDLVARDGRTIVFVEVKARSARRYGLPQEAVTRTKQMRLTRLAQWYLKRFSLEGCSARFDVIAIIWNTREPEVTWIANAFEACS